MNNNYFSGDKVGRLKAKEYNEKVNKLVEEEYNRRSIASSKLPQKAQEALNRNTRELLLKHISDSLV